MKLLALKGGLLVEENIYFRYSDLQKLFRLPPLLCRPGRGVFFWPTDDHFSDFKWQRVSAAQLGKSVCVFLGGTGCCAGREQKGRQLPFRSPGGNDPRQKITLRPGLCNYNNNF
jgi:hypothetical protein